MAQAQIRNLNTIVNKLYGGMSNDDYLGLSDASGSPMSFYDGENIEIRKQAKYVTLNNGYNLFLDLGTRTGDVGDILCMFSNGETSKAYGTNTGKIYSNSGSVAQSGLTVVYNMFQDANSSKCFAIHGGGDIASWTIDSTPSTGAAGGTFNPTLHTLSDWALPNNTNVPLIIFNGYAYIGAGTKIWRYDITNNTSVVALNVESGYNVTGLTLIGDRIYVYASNGSSGIQYLWNGSEIITGSTTTGSLSQIRWYDKPIINVANINNVDYIVAGDSKKRSLYRVNGYQPELIFQSKFETDTYNGKFFFKPDFTNAIETINNTIYIPADGCIYSWGHNIAGMPDSAVREVTLPTNSVVKSPTLLNYISSENRLYFAYYDTDGNTKVCYISMNETGAYNLEVGTAILNPIISNLYSNENSALKLRVGYDLPPKVSGNTVAKINVYSKYDYNGGYKNFYCKTSYETLEVGAVYTDGSTQYTVYAITRSSFYLNLTIVHCTKTDVFTDIKDINKINNKGTISKLSGIGPSTISFYRTTVGLKLIGTIDDETKHKQLMEINDANFQMTLAFDLISYESGYSPRLWDIVYAYSEIENDI